jgi:hypothetical protein
MLAALVLLAACSRAPAPWEAADLRLLDPPDDAPSAGTDIIALYSRPVGKGQQVRVDFLDLGETPPERVYLAFDTAPGGSPDLPGTKISTNLAWDWLVSIPGSLTARLHLPDGSLPQRETPATSYDLAQDSLTVTLPPDILPAQFRFQAVVVFGDGGADSTAPVASDARPPARAPVLLSFWDVFPAGSPATALRRWDGSHSGPYGERHGLHPLLDAAAKHNVPVVLLDLLTPRGLSALELVGGLDQVRQMQADGSLVLAETDFGNPPYPEGIQIEANREVAQRFGFPRSVLVYALSRPGGANYDFQFTPVLGDLTHLSRDESLGLTVAPLPADDAAQADPQGLTLATRRALLATALSAAPDDIVSLGGSLPDSTWGDSDVAEAALSYIGSHPWIEPLNLQKLSQFPTTPAAKPPQGPLPLSFDRFTSSGNSAGMDSQTLTVELAGRLNGAAPGPLRDAAWDMFTMLAAAGRHGDSSALAAQYLGEVGALAAANDWAHAPTPQASCGQDIDYDHVNECVLANEQLFAVFERDGGRLAWLFSVKHGQPHELIGGTDQFIVGLSDRSLWQIEHGTAADPEQIPGAFVDWDAPWSLYEVTSFGPDSLTLTSSNGSRAKSFRLLDNGVSGQYSLMQPVRARFALTLDPWLRFNRNWGMAYYSRRGGDNLTWSARDGLSLTIQAPGATGFAAFNDTLESLYGPEDPNQEFPLGHFLPFPMAVADYRLEDGAIVQIVVK